MFSLFKKNAKTTRVPTIVWLSKAAKYKGLISHLEEMDAPTVFVAFFEKTLEEATFVFEKTGKTATILEPQSNMLEESGFFIVQASAFDKQKMSWQKFFNENKVVVRFIERYPLSEAEQKLWQQIEDWQPECNMMAHTALDEPLMEVFSSERIKALLQNMGATSDEGFQHQMIDKSIERLQKKIAKNLTVEKKAKDMATWFEQNHIPAKK